MIKAGRNRVQADKGRPGGPAQGPTQGDASLSRGGLGGQLQKQNA